MKKTKQYRKKNIPPIILICLLVNNLEINLPIIIAINTSNIIPREVPFNIDIKLYLVLIIIEAI